MHLHSIPANSRMLRKCLYRGCGFALLPIGLHQVQCGTLAEMFNRHKRQKKLVQINLERKCPAHIPYRPAPREMTSYTSSDKVLGCFRLCAIIARIKKLIAGLCHRSFVVDSIPPHAPPEAFVSGFRTRVCVRMQTRVRNPGTKASLQPHAPTVRLWS